MFADQFSELLIEYSLGIVSVQLFLKIMFYGCLVNNGEGKKWLLFPPTRRHD